MIPVLVVMFLYALLHSYLAGTNAKNAFKARFGERAYYGLYRLMFNIIGVITLLPSSYLFVFYPDGIVWEVDLQYEPILLAIQLIGLIGAAVSLIQIDIWQFIGLRQLLAYVQNQPLPLPSEVLQTSGLYALVRHPLYLFTMLAMLPVTTMTGAYFGFCIGVGAYFAIGSFYEERRLAAAFGADYEAYRQRVPWLLPLPRPRTANKSL
jgi:protein-S-isoprenylcysteine O-methyltransferase Ste14